MAGGWASALGKLKRAPKVAAWTGVAVAGAAAFGAWALSSRSKAKHDASNELANVDLNQDLQPPMPQPLTQSQADPSNMMAGQQQPAQPDAVVPPAIPQQVAEPADGRTPGEWQQRVAAERGGVDQSKGSAQPNQNVVPESSVENLGSETPPQSTR